MASVKFQSIANNHKSYLAGLNTTWTEANVRKVSRSPYFWITADEAEAIVATGGDIVSSWYDFQHTSDPVILGVNMTPTPDGWDMLMAAQAAAIEAG